MLGYVGKDFRCCLCCSDLSCNSYRDSPQTSFDPHLHLDDTPNCPVPTFNTPDLDAGMCLTPVTCQVPPESMAETIAPCMPSISATPGFSAFKQVVNKPVHMQSEAPSSDSSMSPQKVSVVPI